MAGPSDDPIFETYLHSILRVDVIGGPVEIRPVEQGIAVGTWPFADILHVISAWNPGEHLTTDAENGRLHASLLREVRGLGVASMAAVAIADDQAWAEACVATVGVDREVAIGLGQRFSQPAIVEVDRSSLHILGCTDGAVVEQGRMISDAVSRPCPMRPREDPTSERCRDPGGPWVGRSIEASALWQHRRDGFLRLLGCDVCGGGMAAGPGGRGVLVDPPPAPSRRFRVHHWPAYYDYSAK